MTMVGAQLGELRALVSQLGGPLKAQLDSDLNAMNSKVQASADKFRHDFATFVKQTNVGLNRVLEEASKVSGQNLNAIEAATGSHA